ILGVRSCGASESRVAPRIETTPAQHHDRTPPQRVRRKVARRSTRLNAQRRPAGAGRLCGSGSPWRLAMTSVVAVAPLAVVLAVAEAVPVTSVPVEAREAAAVVLVIPTQ